MRRSTLLFGLICAVLTGTLTAIGSWLWSANQQSVSPVTDVSLRVGLPYLRHDDKHSSISAASAVLWDKDAHVIRFAKDAFTPRPIASLTKLVTAMVVIDTNVDWEQLMTITDDEWRVGGRLTLAPGETVTMRDLLYASLVGSANNATLALVRGTNIPTQEFIYRMNRKVIALGLEQTEFHDVTGLNPANVSTAYEMARIAAAAFNDYPLIHEVTSQKRYEHTIGGTGRQHTIVNTNNLLVDYDYHLSGSKTGYLNEAGFCLAVQGADKSSHYIAIVLGAPSEWDSMEDIKTLLESN